MRAPRWQGFVLLALGVGLAANSVLGPLLTGRIRYHLGPSLLNQTIGLDAASLFMAAALGAHKAGAPDGAPIPTGRR